MPADDRGSPFQQLTSQWPITSNFPVQVEFNKAALSLADSLGEELKKVALNRLLKVCCPSSPVLVVCSLKAGKEIHELASVVQICTCTKAGAPRQAKSCCHYKNNPLL